MRKSEAAMLLRNQIGRIFGAIITGITSGNVWVRVFDPPAEGKLDTSRPLKVCQLVKVKLDRVHVDRGYIDFELVA